MKKTLTLLLAFIVITATSCVKKYEQVTPNQTILTSVSASQWTTTDGGKTYSVLINMPEIDSYFNQHGGVLVYGTFGNNVYEQFPEVFGGVAYSFSHKPGSLEIDIQSSNGTSTISPPGSLGLKIVLVDSI